jgi:pimeloyl-ACP methyl ester carboxylesterase
MILFLLIIPIILIGILAAGFYFYRTAFFPNVHPAEETLKYELENGRLQGYTEIQTWTREEILIHSPHGYDLFGYYYPVTDSRKTVILTHGITLSLFGSMKYMHLFRQHGFNIVIYDNRFHGRSGGEACSFGFFEKDDLKAVVDWAIAKGGPDTVVGTHGESLGAAITLQHAVIDLRISFAISDCAFSNLDQLFHIRLGEDYHLPPFPVLSLCGWFARIFLGFNYIDVSPIQKIGMIETPILFIHGDKDTYIPPKMSINMHQQKTRGVRRIYLAKDAKHAASLVTDRNEYQRQVDQFLLSIGVIEEVSETRSPL